MEKSRSFFFYKVLTPALHQTKLARNYIYAIGLRQRPKTANVEDVEPELRPSFTSTAQN